MSESSFFATRAGLTLREIVALTGATPPCEADLERRITGIATLDRAGPSDLCCLDDADASADAWICQGAACLTTRDLASLLPVHVAALLVEQASTAFLHVSRALFPDALRASSLFEATGVAASAIVHPSARLEPGVTIDPGAVIGPRAEIGAATLVGSGAVVGPGVRIGRHCAIAAHVSLSHALVGDRVTIHAGCRIGQAGPGGGIEPSGHAGMPRVGRVIIQDDVEIGANTVIDRGTLSDTVIGEGSKIDNLVQIAHNATIGRHCVLAAQTEIAASADVGDGTVIHRPTEREQCS